MIPRSREKLVPPSTNDVTGWLVAWRSGDQTALDKLVPVIYQELHRLARRHMRRERGVANRGQTLQTTALVNEVYLKLVDASQVRWENRAHFLAIAANLMRRILVDAARTRGYAKRGGEQRRVLLEEAAMIATPRGADLVALDDALSALAKVDPRKARVVELRFFGGLSVEESAHVLNVSAGTVLRDWRLSKSWLMRELSGTERSQTGDAKS
jgi:RNA polymerase sigma-70 factor (ECF subfamily)